MKMNYKNMKEFIQRAKEKVKDPIVQEVAGNFEAFIDLRYQAEGKESDYELKLKEARDRFMHSAKMAVMSFGISQETLESHLKKRLEEYTESSPEKEALERSLMVKEEPKKVSHKSLKNKTGKV
jgi:hypothetical protein